MPWPLGQWLFPRNAFICCWNWGTMAISGWKGDFQASTQDVPVAHICRVFSPWGQF